MRCRHGLVVASFLFAVLRAQPTPPSHSCQSSDLHLPRKGQTPSNDSSISPLPLLVFSRGLAFVPHDLLTNAKHRPPVIALASHVDDSALRAVLRARVHVALTSGEEARFQSATSRDLLLRWIPDGENTNGHAGSMEVDENQNSRSSLFNIYVHRNENVLFDQDASEWLSAHPADEEASDAEGNWHSLVTKDGSSLEGALSLDQIHCAYDHWSCDFVAEGELFYPYCQRLRLEFAARTETNIDLFKFADKNSPFGLDHTARTLLTPHRRNLDGDSGHSPSQSFVERHRSRVEAAYSRLRSTSATAEAPIKQIMYMLFTLTDAEIEEFGTHSLSAASTLEIGKKSMLDAKLDQIGATMRYEDMGSRQLWLTSKLSWLRTRFPLNSHLLLGLALIAFGVRGTVGAMSSILFIKSPRPGGTRGHAGSARFPKGGTEDNTGGNSDTEFRKGGRLRRGASHAGHGSTRIGQSESQFSIPSFLMNRAQNLSKTS